MLLIAFNCDRRVTYATGIACESLDTASPIIIQDQGVLLDRGRFIVCRRVRYKHLVGFVPSVIHEELDARILD